MKNKEHEVMVSMVIPVNDLPQNILLAKEIQDDPFVRSNFDKYEQLTDREKEIIALVAREKLRYKFQKNFFWQKAQLIPIERISNENRN